MGEGDWRLRAIRGATTVTSNTIDSVTTAVDEMLDALEAHNPIEPSQIVSVTFSVTPDVDAVFPAKIARQRPGWDRVPLLDLQQMTVPGSLPCCIRILIQINTTLPQSAIVHRYLRKAQYLRPDLNTVTSNQ